jgi:hypothetical protein
MSNRNDNVGFIGMGMMGGGMAANLMKADFPLVAYDIDQAKNERFAGLGATIANGPAGVASAASTVICIVETTAQVREVLSGTGALSKASKPVTRWSAWRPLIRLPSKRCTISSPSAALRCWMRRSAVACRGRTLGNCRLSLVAMKRWWRSADRSSSRCRPASFIWGALARALR